MRVAGPLRLKINVLIVLHPPQRERARPIDPRVVVLGHDHSSLARRRIEREDPAVFVISGASRDDCFGSIFGPEWLRELDITVARFIRPWPLPAARSGLRPAPFAFALIGCGFFRGRRLELLSVIHPFHFTVI